MSILEVNNLKKIYTTRSGGNQVEALKNVSFSMEKGEYVVIVGESGSGETTLLNILAALDKSTGGSMLLDARDSSKIRGSEIAFFRRDSLGFVFRDFNLLDMFSLMDNIYFSLVLAGVSHQEMERHLKPIAEQFGIPESLSKYPYEASGGQKQCVTVVRALTTNPRPILADELTDTLDSRSIDELLQLFAQVNLSGQTILMVTHSVKTACHAGRVLFIEDGEVFYQTYRDGNTKEAMYQKISDTLIVLAIGGDRK